MVNYSLIVTLNVGEFLGIIFDCSASTEGDGVEIDGQSYESSTIVNLSTIVNYSSKFLLTIKLLLLRL